MSLCYAIIQVISYDRLTLIFSVVFVYTDMIPGLQQGQEKMSKSDPSSAIYMEDEEVLYTA